MSDQLLDRVLFLKEAKEHGVPSIMEFEADPSLAPFLVSSTRSVMWAEELSHEGFLRAATRPVEGLYQEIVIAIAERALEEDWENIYDLNESGVSQAILDLRSVGVEEWEILVCPTLLEKVQSWAPEQSEQIVKADWLPLKSLVVVPKDRSLLGTEGYFGDLVGLAVVHNARHGIGIAFEDEGLADEGDQPIEPE